MSDKSTKQPPDTSPEASPESSPESSKDTAKAPSNFIRNRIEQDMETGRYGGRLVTRFPPEPNGYLHIGHAKSICLNFGFAREFDGTCHLRFDDTNPIKENVAYVESIKEDVHWLGFDWGAHLYFTSDYFDQLYAYAIELIKAGKAYVDSLSPDEIRAYRGTLTEAGRESPYRDRPVEESLDLFKRMAAGEFDEGQCVLRARIDMAAPNILMRDPTLYRIRKQSHHRTGEKWCIYPMYDFAHCLSDSIEGITHSICTIEFENNRELYDWILDALDVYHPQQIEFARLNLSHTLLSKRKLIGLVEGGYVDGWDDPRMPTISGFRRRGYTPEAIRNFCDRIGVAKRDSLVDLALLEHCIREDLNKRAARYMAVLRPLKVVIENYPEGETEMLEAINNPEDESMGRRQIPFSRELFIDREDFMEEPPKKFFRLAPGREVRLRYAYFITCRQAVKDSAGEIVELRCTYDPETRGGDAPDGRKVKSTLHWVSTAHAVGGEIRQYDHLFTVEDPAGVEDFTSVINPQSMEIISDAKLEPALADLKPAQQCQFERVGYFCPDVKYSTPEHPVFNRIVTLRDQWAKIKKAQQKGGK